MSSKDLAVSVRELSKSYLIAHNRNRPTNVQGGDRRPRQAPAGDQPAETRDVLGTQGRGFRHPAGRVRRHHRPQRRRQEHAAEDPLADHRADQRACRHPGPRRQPAGGRHRLPPRAHRPREHLPQRHHPRHDARGRSSSKFDEIVAFAEVEKFLDTPVKRYSSGMYVRLAFAVAAHLEPEILIVDEVLAVGDAAVPEEVPRQDAGCRSQAGARSCSSATT